MTTRLVPDRETAFAPGRAPKLLRSLICGLAFLSAAVACEPDHSGDLSVIRDRGVLRIITPRTPRQRRLPRDGHPFDMEKELAAEFAGALGLEPRFIPVANHDDLVPALVEGRGDIIAATLTVTPEREESIGFSRSVGSVREVLVTRLSDTTLTEPAALAGRKLALRPSSSFWQTALQLSLEHPGLEMEAVSERMTTEEILYRVEQGEYDATIADDNLVDQAFGYMPGLRAAFVVSDERPTAFGLRRDAIELKAAIDSFLQHIRPAMGRSGRYVGDLPSIRERGVLRVLTRNSAATYFIWRGQLMGFEYDLAVRFAERLGVRLEVVVPPTRADLLPWLEQGRGDLVAAGLTTTRERAVGNVSFSEPYNYVVETLVSRADESRITDTDDLAGRTIVVRRRSSYWDTAQRLLAAGSEFELVAAPESLETEVLVDLVAAGEYDLTIADSHILDIELSWRDDVKGVLTVGDTAVHAWAVRREDQELKAAIDEFVNAEYRGRWFNITYNKYFKTRHRILERASERPSRTGRISAYDELFRKYAERFGFDWRLIAAQAYEESRFDPLAVSSVGAAGLMQVMRATAASLGVDDLANPDRAVFAGTRYLRDQYELFDDAATEQDHLWFALASYNAGYGHITDARRIAEKQRKDPNRWFGEVEQVMPLLARAEYHRNTRYGYCRGQVPVNYVRQIRDRYGAYRAVVDSVMSR